jgi:TonB family protein
MPLMGQRGHSTPQHSALPRLGVAWEPRGRSLRESIDALLHGPWSARSPADSGLDSPNAPLYIGPSWIASLHARNALLASTLLHVIVIMVFVLRPVPIPRAEEAAPESAPYELTWYPLRDLPRLSPPGRRNATRASASEINAAPRRGADAYNPHQTILSHPVVPTHPRQTLIVPRAPLRAPKILPPLPNVVQWSEIAPSAQPAPPSLSAQASNQTPLLPKRGNQKLASPEIRSNDTGPGMLLFADAAPVVPRPRLPVTPGGSRPTTPVAHTGGQQTPAPQIGVPGAGSSTTQDWIALSADPTPVPPPAIPPEGNLSANFSVSPDGLRHGDPSGSRDGGMAGGGAGGGSGSGAVGSPGGDGGGPAGISISGGNPNGTVSGSGAAHADGHAGTSLPTTALNGRSSLHVLPGSLASSSPRPAPSPKNTDAASLPSGLIDPEHVLKTKQFYTLFVNMPNLTSSAGSWVMNFAELDSEGNPAPRREGLSGPVPLRKVDPKYPPDMVNEHVQGEVLLYAIIRADGSVDSVQLLRGIEPELDRNAMEALSRWKFRPGLRNNQPVELEAFVRIPFRYNPL